MADRWVVRNSLEAAITPALVSERQSTVQLHERVPVYQCRVGEDEDDVRRAVPEERVDHGGLNYLTIFEARWRAKVFIKLPVMVLE